MTVSKYHESLQKRLLDLVMSIAILTAATPIILLIALIVAVTTPGPVFFIQKRTGMRGKTFNIVKFRTMVAGAEKLQKKYKALNESDGPAFKIKNDPRFTPFGKLLSRTGLDELPQLVNVLRGEMSLIGPRPLPLPEAKKLTGRYRFRQTIKPGITSTWVVNGSHKLKFKKWMELDLDYVKNASFSGDLKIIFGTIRLISYYMAESVRIV